MRSAEPDTRVEPYQSLDALPADAEPLFDAATTFFSSRAWWEAVLAHAIPPGAQPRLLLVRSNGDAAALFPMLLDSTGRGFRALTTPYTCLYEPLIASGRTDRTASFMAFAQFCRSFPTTRLDALNKVTEADMSRGGKQARLAVARFHHFGAWHENVANLDWQTYLARRPGMLRETIRRRMRRAERLARADFQLFQGTDNLAAGIIAFETVYARSWKEPEPYPNFNPAQIRAAGSIGVCRLGIWSIDGSPAAAQFWIVEHGRATVLKLAHDEAFKAHSPGTVLTAWMIRHMIEHEHVTELDFGRGDDTYKQLWAANRRQLSGLLLINPYRARGLVVLAHHKLGRVRVRLRLAGRACHDPVS
ncbi:MAG: GNAT family N-acetyltransferase [Acetobacteraceae bacterium]|jgi:CelD/BcsL family acetyltransferase involved in cellulose biosynthesis